MYPQPSDSTDSLWRCNPFLRSKPRTSRISEFPVPSEGVDTKLGCRINARFLDPLFGVVATRAAVTCAPCIVARTRQRQ